MMLRRRFRIPCLVLVALLAGCDQQVACPQWNEACRDAETVESPMQYATTGAIRTFLGKNDFKIAFTRKSHLYLLLPGSSDASSPRVLLVDRGDEGQGGGIGDPNSPAFSDDGSWLAFAGDFLSQGNTRSFVVHADSSSGFGTRAIVSRNGQFLEPRWHAENGTAWLYGVDRQMSTWSASDSTVNGGTYRVSFAGGSLGSVERATVRGNSVPGAFKGGISRDGHWMATSYGASVLWNVADNVRYLLNSGVQQCNPSINPYDSTTTAHGDYFMILGFGGTNPVPTVDGNGVVEGQHEHLWIWNHANKAVWKADLPSGYEEWQRPRWSTHPDFATALAKRNGSGDIGNYDLFLVKIDKDSSLSIGSESSLQSSVGLLKLVWNADVSFASRDWSHMWVLR